MPERIFPPLLPRQLVLVADDNPDLLECLSQILQCDLRYETVTARDGLEALEIALSRHPYAAVMDIDMPRMGGMESARRMRGALGVQRPRLIAVTGGIAILEVRTSGQFDHVLPQPVDTELLIQLLSA